MKKRKWSDYLWVVELLYLCLGLFNILFAWLGMLFFTIPLLVAVFGGSKAYCNRYCGRGQLLSILGEKLKLSRNAPPPKFLRSRWFRYGFLVFFMVMFGRMLLATYQVFAGAPLSQTVTLLWTFRLPWQWADVSRQRLGRHSLHLVFLASCSLPPCWGSPQWRCFVPDPGASTARWEP